MFGWRRLVRRRVVVNLLSGHAISGVLYRKSGQLLTIKDSVVHEPGSDPIPADGELVVERSQVDYIQIVG